MNLVFHQFREGFVDNPLRGQSREPAESIRNNQDLKVPTSTLCAEVALVERTLIDDRDVLRLQLSTEDIFDCLCPGGSFHGLLLDDGYFS